MCRFWIFLFLLYVSNQALAMDAFEYQVYDAEINKVAEYSLETHLNSNLSGKVQGDYAGKLSENHLTHLTFEFARGMTDVWELGGYLQTAMGSDQVARYAGAKIRSKFVIPRQEEDSFQWGVNFEISDVPHPFEEDRYASEIRPIVVKSYGDWSFVFNPIIDMNLTAGASATPDFNPGLKVVRDTHRGYGLGLEYYNELGEINKLNGFDRGEQYAFATFDLLKGPFELNLGLGAGLNPASNPTVAKGIFGITF